jgi:hypothetical protein
MGSADNYRVVIPYGTGSSPVAYPPRRGYPECAWVRKTMEPQKQDNLDVGVPLVRQSIYCISDIFEANIPERCGEGLALHFLKKVHLVP